MKKLGKRKAKRIAKDLIIYRLGVLSCELDSIANELDRSAFEPNVDNMAMLIEALEAIVESIEKRLQ